MQILRLLAVRRAASTITASQISERRNEEEAIFDLDVSSSSGSLSFSDSDDECTVLDFIISRQRSSSASPLISGGATAPLNFRASDPLSKVKTTSRRGINSLRTLCFGARKAVPLYGRPSFALNSSGRRSSSSERSLRLFMDSTEDEHAIDAEQTSRRASSRDVIRRCLRRIRTAASPRAATAVEARGLHRLRKYRLASSAARRHDLDVEKQEGIDGAIAHCKESLHRASTSECDSQPLRPRSEPEENVNLHSLSKLMA